MTNEFSAPHLERFDNPVTRNILIVLLVLIIGGCLLALTGTFKGVLTGALLAVTGAILWAMGEVHHGSDKPRIAGILTFGDTPIMIDEKPVIVGGDVILAPYAPFYLDSTKVNIDNDEHFFEFDVVTGDVPPLPIHIKISLIGRANLNDIMDFIQAGNDIKKVWKQIEPIAFTKAIGLTRKLTGEKIQAEPELVSTPLTEQIENVFETKSFGTTLINIKVEAHLPKPLLDALIEVKKEDYQREAELREYETMSEAAKKRQRAYARERLENPHPGIPLTNDEVDDLMRPLIKAGTIPDLDQCIEKIRTLRLVKDEKVFRVENATNGTGNFTLSELKIDMGGKKSK